LSSESAICAENLGCWVGLFCVFIGLGEFCGSFLVDGYVVFEEECFSTLPFYFRVELAILFLKNTFDNNSVSTYNWTHKKLKTNQQLRHMHTSMITYPPRQSQKGSPLVKR